MVHTYTNIIRGFIKNTAGLRLTTYLTLAIILTLCCFSSCSSPPSTTSTSSTTYTSVQINAEDIRTFFDGAKDRYINGITCGGTQYQPSVNGISPSDLLSLTILDDATLTMSGKLYRYGVLQLGSRPMSTTLNIGTYEITVGNPETSVTPTGGNPVLIQAAKNGNAVGEFTYYEVYMQFSAYSVYITTNNIDELAFLFIYYKLTCDSYDHLWIVLLLD
jgi:hypothetical protein